MKFPLLAGATALATTLTVAGSASAFTIQSADDSFKTLINDGVFEDYIHTEYQALDADFVASRQLNLSDLTLKFDHEVKVHFLSEGANFRNQLGVNVSGATEISDTILFDDIVCVTDSCSTFKGYRDSHITPERYLEAGDLVNLGMIKAGSTLDFFLNSNGFNRSNPQRLHLDASKNPGGHQQVMAYQESGYLVLAFEDVIINWGGSDKDFNDVVFAIDIGEKNLRHLNGETVPEPTLLFGLLGVSGAFSLLGRKRENA
ncbi:DUF4114 domain-containing protein [Geitlerinema sp. P-1104]|uniref:DUF4114 domain-containing protein n=1 Tax=Geitlerinema sp. P-1104 TaxID=2546230 RepID=UPI0014769A1B|nr:DUF4114 domain-containing protein [Geitlerinema sp. P-1104]NMG57005.1 DUF4114 domain-containing protein [Geitlerinema sp. P-1104]